MRVSSYASRQAEPNATQRTVSPKAESVFMESPEVVARQELGRILNGSQRTQSLIDLQARADRSTRVVAQMRLQEAFDRRPTVQRMKLTESDTGSEIWQRLE